MKILKLSMAKGKEKAIFKNKMIYFLEYRKADEHEC